MSRSKRSSPTTRNDPVAAEAARQAALLGLAAANSFAGALAASVAAAPTGVVISDPTQPDCPIVFANPAFHRITGYPPEEVVGRNCRFLQGPGTDPAAVHAIRQAIAQAAPIDIRLVNYRRDGKRFINELHISPVHDAAGKLILLLGIQHDVTERVKAEEAARRARRAAERANAEKSDFLAFVSHEVRTPLNGVLGTLSLLLDTPLDSEQRAYAETARRSGETLLWTVNELLDLSRIEAGQLELEDLAFDPGQPVRDVLGLLAATAADKGLRLSASLDAALPARIMGDARRLRQVLLNLVDNAIKFTASGAVEIKVVAESGRLVVEVRDTGAGIPPQLRRRLFRRFQQADAGTARRHGGSGLGLMICRRLVGLMGGQIGVESEPGAGSVFRFDLPLRPAAEDAPGLPDITRAEAPARRLAGDAPFARLLLVEDSEASQLVAAAILRKAGYEVDLARDGETAVEAAASGSYDAVLMDVRMPGLDGYEATRRIRALGGAAGRVRILALTASAMPGDVRRSLSAGMDAHLTKPIDRAGLLGAVAALLAAVPVRPLPCPTGAGDAGGTARRRRARALARPAWRLRGGDARARAAAGAEPVAGGGGAGSACAAIRRRDLRRGSLARSGHGARTCRRGGRCGRCRGGCGWPAAPCRADASRPVPRRRRAGRRHRIGAFGAPPRWPAACGIATFSPHWGA